MRKKILLYFVILFLAVGWIGISTSQALTPKEQLGKSIFFDERLSINNNQSCATCHAPNAGWTGPDSNINKAGAVYDGSVPGAFGDRKPPSSAYATQSPVLHVDKKGLFTGGNFWDGRATGETLGSAAAEQALGPFLNPKEQALNSASDVVTRVCASVYGWLFKEVWGPEICNPANVASAYDKIGYSIAAYEASTEVNAFSSKYDYSLPGKAELSKQERKGLALFQGKGKCSKCHVIDGRAPLFTDFTYDNLGVPKNPENPATIADPNWADPGLGGFLATRPDYAKYADANMGKHKVPTLRNVDLRAFDEGVKAYGHNGYFKSLEGIVHFYNTRDVKPVCPEPYTEAEALAENCWPAPEVAQNVNTGELGDLGLTKADEAAIVAFMKTLSDGYTPPSKKKK
ncbi:MAG: Methylamine utilization protein MauG precursor [Syntrophus sp. PtaU1.Bin005]|nr:MAG: Methylamine utilization protein MauG precursor [Syntrophus sp. PtaU1.Bin005]